MFQVMNQFLNGIPEWKDEERINALFAAFPKDYGNDSPDWLKRKMAFWEKVVQDFFIFAKDNPQLHTPSSLIQDNRENINPYDYEANGNKKDDSDPHVIDLPDRGESIFIYSVRDLQNVFVRDGMHPLGMSSVVVSFS